MTCSITGNIMNASSSIATLRRAQASLKLTRSRSSSALQLCATLLGTAMDKVGPTGKQAGGHRKRGNDGGTRHDGGNPASASLAAGSGGPVVRPQAAPVAGGPKFDVFSLDGPPGPEEVSKMRDDGLGFPGYMARVSEGAPLPTGST